MSSAVTSKPRTNLDDPGLIIAVEPAADGGTLLKMLGGGCIQVVDSPQETRRYLLTYETSSRGKFWSGRCPSIPPRA